MINQKYVDVKEQKHPKIYDFESSGPYWTVRGSNPGGARFSAPIQTSPRAHPASYAMGTGSFLGVKQTRRGVDHPPPSSAEVQERIRLYLYSPFGPSWAVLG